MFGLLMTVLVEVIPGKFKYEGGAMGWVAILILGLGSAFLSSLLYYYLLETIGAYVFLRFVLCMYAFV